MTVERFSSMSEMKQSTMNFSRSMVLAVFMMFRVMGVQSLCFLGEFPWGNIEGLRWQLEEAAGVVVHAAADGLETVDGLVAFPDAGVVGAEDEGRATVVRLDDGVEEAASAKAVVIAAQAVVLEEEDPGGATILAGEELVVGGDAIGKEEGDGEVPSSPLVAAVPIALHDEGETVGRGATMHKGERVGTRLLVDVEGILAAGHEVALAPVDAPYRVVAVDAFGLGEMVLECALLDEVVDIEEGVDTMGLVAHLDEGAVVAAAGIVAHSRRHDVAESDLLAAEIVVNPRGDFLAILLEIGDDVGHK